MRKLLSSLLDGIRIVERALIISINLIMVGLYTFNVLIREMMPQYSSTFAWIDEATRLLMVWAVFLALGLALERGRQVAVTTLLERMPDLPRKIIQTLINLTGIVFSCYLSWLGVALVKFVMRTGQVSPTLGLPMYWLYVAPTIGFLLLALRYGLELAGINDRHNRPILTQTK
ncbi:TRAP transporter small permease [Maridesulfovibrio hydrothermalis]|uniref:Tripartite ATP-independent periplasmic transporter DctQ component n=1 Tax=Maridesulfovibrio hydrothermalis AM13 = DSM 14728 TaxID=1121451 RepID=L0RFK7_9BACT|nr:TRAP transporter small permease [Maridesulfovibrio hydrothermalis]CCO24351.1 Tripartite ATP-independent periplasmic transporter DctQ component [Maridesulfovibrio hydrothermalis AM13 = DSM 14728]